MTNLSPILNNLNSLSYIDSLFDATPQCSEAWFQSTRGSVGGSRAAALVNAHPSIKFNQLPDYIINPPPPLLPTLPLVMGSFFEPLHIQIASFVLQSPIIEPGKFAATNYSHFSPDGICVDRLNRAVLCEFKTPFSRAIPINNQGLPYKVPTSYKIQCQYSMYLMPLLSYSYFQDLCLWIRTAAYSLPWVSESAMNNARRRKATALFGSAYCEFYSEQFGQCQSNDHPDGLYNIGRLPTPILINCLPRLKAVRPWNIQISEYGRQQIKAFQINVLQYPAHQIDSWEHQSAHTPCGIFYTPNCFLQCDLDIIGMAQLTPDYTLHTALAQGLESTITSIKKKTAF